MANSRCIAVTVLYAPTARQIHEITLQLSTPCDVLHAVQQSGFLARFPELDTTGILLGVWGRRAKLDQTLRENDRIEIYRPLRVDPKVARRERFVKQGARTAGLFAKKRLPAKTAG
jgi:putative ubiquitin-RnfH superfamily antitoxin RatB of RatAB toxin-antitoxin module